MIRLLGFLVGSAASVGAILWILGVPDLPDSEPVVADTAIADSMPPPVMPVEEPQTELPITQITDQAVPDPVDEPVVEIALLDDDLKWHSFWDPFSSEIAANGFVRQLEEVTGFDYRVVKIKTGVYEVAFAYADDPERRDKLSRITSATGLDIPES